LDELISRYQREDVRIAQETIDLMELYPWPGNIREMSNALEYAMVHLEGSVIQPRHLPPELAQIPPIPHQLTSQTYRVQPPVPVVSKGYYKPAEPMQEKELIQQTLAATHGNRSATAEQLGMSRTTLWKRMKKYGLG